MVCFVLFKKRFMCYMCMVLLSPSETGPELQHHDDKNTHDKPPARLKQEMLKLTGASPSTSFELTFAHITMD